MTLPPSTSGDSLISQGICRPPKSARMLRCHLMVPSAMATHARSPTDDFAVGAVQARDGAGALRRGHRLDEQAIALDRNRSVAGA